MLFRHLMVLADTEKELREQLNEKKDQLKMIRPSTAKMRADQKQISVFENRCQEATIKLNALQS